MDDVVHRLSRELADAMAAAVADDHRVEACHERARAAGYNMKVSLEASSGSRTGPRGRGWPRAASPWQKVGRWARSG